MFKNLTLITFVIHFSIFAHCTDQLFDMQIIAHPFSIPKTPTDEPIQTPNVQASYILLFLQKVDADSNTVQVYTILEMNNNKPTNKLIENTEPFVTALAQNKNGKIALQRALGLESRKIDGYFGLGSLTQLIEKITTPSAIIEWGDGPTQHRLKGTYLANEVDDFPYADLLENINNNTTPLPNPLLEFLQIHFKNLSLVESQEASNFSTSTESLPNDLEMLHNTLTEINNTQKDFYHEFQLSHKRHLFPPPWSISTFTHPHFIVLFLWTSILFFFLRLMHRQDAAYVKNALQKSNMDTVKKRDMEIIFQREMSAYKSHLASLKSLISEIQQQNNMQQENTQYDKKKADRVTEGNIETESFSETKALNSHINTVPDTIELKKLYQDYLHTFNKTLSDYKKGNPITIDSLPNSPLPLLNYVGTLLLKWKGELEEKSQLLTFHKNNSHQILEIVDLALKQVTSRIKNLRTGEIPIDPISFSDLTNSNAPTKLKEEQETLQQLIQQHEAELAGQCQMQDHPDFLRNLILDTLFSEIGRMAPQEIPGPLSELIQWIGYQIQPILTGQTEADSRYHEISQTRYSPGNENKVIEILMPGLSYLKESGVYRKAVVIRGE